MKPLIVAFSIYSKIPMPQFMWDSKDMQYHLIFFPWVGAVIGGLEYLLYYLYTGAGQNIGTLFYACLAIAIPLLITGGFHVDGFMDTMDALHSYQDKEKKLEILKDPHIGAFSVICLVTYLMLAMGFISSLVSGRAALVLAICFVLSRVLSAISVITLPSAKKKGMLQTFSTTAAKSVVMIFLIIEGLAALLAMALIDLKSGCLAAAAMAGSYLYYMYMSKKQFGGLTGDLAGFFVCVAELSALILVGVGGFF